MVTYHSHRPPHQVEAEARYWRDHPALRALVHLRPAIARPSLRETLRASIGAGLALLTSGLILALLSRHAGTQGAALVLVAPLGATAFLMFALPNSPLAQPWSAIVGNASSAGLATVVVQFDLPMPLAGGIAVTLAVITMSALRAMHPPGAAIALSAVLAAPFTLSVGWKFALVPVALDTSLLVLMAILWNRATGRAYPFRLPIDAAPALAVKRADMPEPEALEALLTEMRLTANIGVEDLRRVLDEVERLRRDAPPDTPKP